MNRIIQYFFISLLLFPVLFSGCMKQESYPDTPEIGLLSFTSIFDTGQFATNGILSISYRDGNGDIGLNTGDTFPPFQKNGAYYYNYVIRYFEKQDGIFRERFFDPPLSSRIPVLTPLDPGKAIKGIINLSVLTDPFPVYDTIQIKAFIYDRGLNKSNEISTPEIILRRP